MQRSALTMRCTYAAVNNIGRNHNTDWNASISGLPAAKLAEYYPANGADDSDDGKQNAQVHPNSTDYFQCAPQRHGSEQQRYASVKERPKQAARTVAHDTRPNSISTPASSPSSAQLRVNWPWLSGNRPAIPSRMS